MERETTPPPEEVVELVSSMKAVCPESTPPAQQVTDYMDDAAKLPDRSAYLEQHAPLEGANLQLSPIKSWTGPVMGYARVGRGK